MAASAKNVGAWADSNATTQAITLPTHAAGDMLCVVAACKPYTADPTLTGVTGWTRLYSYANGTVANGNGTGSVRQVLFYKEAASSSETNPTVDWGTTSAPGIAVPFVLQKGTGDTWNTPLYANGNTTNATSISVSLSDPGIAANGIGLVIHTTRDNSALTVPDWTQSGATLGTLTEWPATAISTATSNDMAGDMAYRTVTTAGSGNITATGTQAAAETGVTSLVFFGVTSSTVLAPPPVAAVPTVVAPGLSYAQTLTPAAVAATTAVVAGLSWADQVLALGPIAWWRLGETSGIDAYEEINGLYSGYGNTPTLGVSGLVGDGNKAVSFAEASNEYVYEAGTGLPAGSSSGASFFVAFSLASYPNDIQTFIRWGAQSTTTAFHWLFYDNRGTTPPGADDLVWQYSDGLGVSAEWAVWPNAGLSLNTTYRLAVVHDYVAKTVKWYVNGVLQYTTDLSAQDPPVGAVAANKETYLASYTSTYYPLDGILDEPMIFDYALSQADVEALEAAATGGGGFSLGLGPAYFTPAPVTAVVQVPAPDFYAGAGATTLTPSSVAAASGAFAPTLETSLTLAAPVVVAAPVVPTPGFTTQLGVAPPPVASVAAPVAPSLGLVTPLAPGAVAALAGIALPSLATSLSLAPPAVGAGAGATSTNLSLALGFAPLAVSTAGAVVAPTLGLSLALAPAAVPAMGAVPQPTFDAGAGTTDLAPAAVAAATGVPAPTLGLALTLTPAAVASIAALVAPLLGTSVSLTPVAVQAFADIVAGPTLATSVSLAPVAVPATPAIPASEFSTSLAVAPPSVAATVALPVIGFATPLTFAPSAVAAALGVVSPTLDYGAFTFAPDPVVAAVAAPAGLLGTSVGLAPAPAAALLGTPEPGFSLVLTLVPAAVAAALGVPAPAGEYVLALVPEPVAATVGVPLSGLGYDIVITPDPVGTVLLVPSSEIALFVGGDILMLFEQKGRPRYPWFGRGLRPRR